MGSSALYSIYILIWTLYVLSLDAFWFRSDGSHLFRASKQLRDGGTLHKTVGSISLSSTSTNENYTFSMPTPRIIQPILTSQEMVVSSIIPIFEVCNTPGSNTTSCLTIFKTITTTYCSTVLTYAFTKLTISDCEEHITFSTQSSYSLTSTIRPIITPAVSIISSSSTSLTPTTYIQSIVSYYFAPWQSLASGTPSNVTLKICTSDLFEEESCIIVQEVWVVHTEYVPITVTSSLDISTFFSSVSLGGAYKFYVLNCSRMLSCFLAPLKASTPLRVFFPYLPKSSSPLCHRMLQLRFLLFLRLSL